MFNNLNHNLNIIWSLKKFYQGNFKRKSCYVNVLELQLDRKMCKLINLFYNSHMEMHMIHILVLSHFYYKM